MLQRVNEGQDGTRGLLMYGSCPGLNAAEACQRASVDVQGEAELALLRRLVLVFCVAIV